MGPCRPLLICRFDCVIDPGGNSTTLLLPKSATQSQPLLLTVTAAGRVHAVRSRLKRVVLTEAVLFNVVLLDICNVQRYA